MYLLFKKKGDFPVNHLSLLVGYSIPSDLSIKETYPPGTDLGISTGAFGPNIHGRIPSLSGEAGLVDNPLELLVLFNSQQKYK